MNKAVDVSVKKDLDNGPSFCCLGVLGNINGYSDEKLVGRSLLTQEMMDLSGLSSPSGSPDNENKRLKIGGMTYRSLAEANDRGVSFKQIASWIEKNYKDL
jgi:hypothetical protein